MSNKELNSPALWPATFKVASAGWSPGAYAGAWLYDATNAVRFKIITNTADTLLLRSRKGPDAGVWKTFGTPGWTANQFANTARLQSVLQDQAGVRFTILQNTTTQLVLPGGSAPTLPTGTILQGGTAAVRLTSAPSASGTGVWNIQNDAGAVLSTWTSVAGAVTVTDGAETLPVAQASMSIAMDGRGVETMSIQAGFLSGSSPKGTLELQINNVRNGVASPEDGIPGPDPLDPYWMSVPISVDGAAKSTSCAFTTTGLKLIVPCFHPNSPYAVARSYRLKWTPDGTPGTGNLVTQIYAYGVQ